MDKSARTHTHTIIFSMSLPTLTSGFVAVCRLFAGILPRVLWISFGGFIFLGSYQKIWQLLQIPTSRNSASTDITYGVGPQ